MLFFIIRQQIDEYKDLYRTAQILTHTNIFTRENDTFRFKKLCVYYSIHRSPKPKAQVMMSAF